MSTPTDGDIQGPVNQGGAPGALQTLRIGIQLPYFKRGNKPPFINSASEQNANRELLNALANARLVFSDDPNAQEGFQLSEAGLILTLSSSSNDPTQTGGASVKLYRLKSVKSDYLVCRSWDGTNEGAVDTIISKPAKLKNSITGESKMDTLHSYTYTVTGSPIVDGFGIVNATRHDTFDAITEDQRVIPVWELNDPIYAIQIPTITVYDPISAPGGIPSTLLMIGESRQWAEI